MTDLLLPGSTARPVVAAHRGASADAPENTMTAFRAAWQGGANWLETDVQPSMDNVPILIHDDDVDRTTDGSGAVRETRALDLARLDAGSWFAPEFAGEPIPELAQLLAALPAEQRIFLEIKGPHTAEQVLAILQVCRASGVDDRVLLQSFQRDTLATVREIAPDRAVGLLTENWDDDPIAACRDLGAISYNPHHRLLRQQPDPAAAVTALQRAGIAVSVWTADDESDWEFLTELGVDAIMTNKPAALADWLGSR